MFGQVRMPLIAHDTDVLSHLPILNDSGDYSQNGEAADRDRHDGRYESSSACYEHRGPRHCERREAVQSRSWRPLFRCARNDG